MIRWPFLRVSIHKISVSALSNLKEILRRSLDFSCVFIWRDLCDFKIFKETEERKQRETETGKMSPAASISQWKERNWEELWPKNQIDQKADFRTVKWSRSSSHHPKWIIMLKHCSPSSVDVRRRSRRNLLLEDNYNVINNNNIDAVIDVEAMSETSSSSTSSSTSSDGSTTSCIIRTTTTATTSTSTSTSSSNTKPISLKDASTSPLISRVRLFNHNHNLDEAKIPIKVYARCLRADIEYKTLIVGSSTTSRELIWQLLSKYRMRHRDPKLFYLTMDINIKR